MITMTLRFLGKGENAGLMSEEASVHINDGPCRIFVIDGGMVSGAPSIAFHLMLPEGGGVIFETSAKLFVAMGDVIEARYPNLLA